MLNWNRRRTLESLLDWCSVGKVLVEYCFKKCAGLYFHEFISWWKKTSSREYYQNSSIVEARYFLLFHGYVLTLMDGCCFIRLRHISGRSGLRLCLGTKGAKTEGSITRKFLNLNYSRLMKNLHTPCSHLILNKF